VTVTVAAAGGIDRAVGPYLARAGTPVEGDTCPALGAGPADRGLDDAGIQRAVHREFE
jgi:hypothetical protein